MRHHKIFIIGALALAMLSINAGNKKSPKFFQGLDDYVFVPGGKVYVETGNKNKDYDTTRVNSFYISKYEISNRQYTEFLTELQQQQQYDKLLIARIDTLKWRDKYAFNEPYVMYYHKHPAYAGYPVVNITYEGAVLYCKWLSEKYNKVHPDNGYIVEFRLPARAEWIRAARGDNKLGAYSWDGPYLRNSKGIIQCNFLRYGDENIHYNPETKKYEVAHMDQWAVFAGDITAPVKSYFANCYGIYNMCGNVAEMVAEKGIAAGGSYADPGYDVRVESIRQYDEASPVIGFRPVMTFVMK